MTQPGEAGPAGAPRHLHESVGSTNTEALVLARGGECGPLWVVSREQTAGRGRRGRHWHSPPGNLHASLLLTDPCAPAEAAQLSLVAGLALHDALAAVAPGIRSGLRLKWPNDLLVGDAKLAGILVEGEVPQTGVFTAVIGFGVNCVASPPDVGYPATSLAASGEKVEAPEMLDALADALGRRLALWARGAGFDTIRRDWCSSAWRLGQPLRLRVGAEQMSGHFDTIDERGHLVLRLDSGSRRAFGAGEVSLDTGVASAMPEAAISMRTRP